MKIMSKDFDTNFQSNLIYNSPQNPEITQISTGERG